MIQVMEYAVRIKPRRKADEVRLREAIEFQAPAVRKAALAAHAELVKLGVKHAFVGGLAVGAHGYVRATDDVDFLVEPGAFVEHPGGIVTFQPGIPINVGGVRVDYITVGQLGEHVEAELATPVISDKLPTVSVEALVYMKLVAHRMRDRADITELLKRGADVARIRGYLAAHASDLVERYERLVAQAESE